MHLLHSYGPCSCPMLCKPPWGLGGHRIVQKWARSALQTVAETLQQQSCLKEICGFVPCWVQFFCFHYMSSISFILSPSLSLRQRGEKGAMWVLADISTDKVTEGHHRCSKASLFCAFLPSCLSPGCETLTSSLLWHLTASCNTMMNMIGASPQCFPCRLPVRTHTIKCQRDDEVRPWQHDKYDWWPVSDCWVLCQASVLCFTSLCLSIQWFGYVFVKHVTSISCFLVCL